MDGLGEPACTPVSPLLNAEADCLLCKEIDDDVAAAVRRQLTVLLEPRVSAAGVLDSVFASDIGEPLALFTLDGGRCMRPQFLWWAMRACGGGDRHIPVALRLGAALELIQSCALLHDDVMDGSMRRRGKPSFQARLAARHADSAAVEAGTMTFASSAAVLAGDLALAWADDIVAETHCDEAVRLRVLEHWRAMRTEMVAGQYLDLHGQTTRSRSVAQALRTARLKTAQYTVARPLSFGAAVACADARTTRQLYAAGQYAGTAFQLRDDIEGVFGDPATTGKPSGDDVRAGKLTYLVAVAQTRAEAGHDRATLSLLETALGNAELTEDGLRKVREVLIETGAVDIVEQRIEWLLEACHRRLSAAVLSSAGARQLRTLFARAAAPVTPTEPTETPAQASGVRRGLRAPRGVGAQATEPACSPHRSSWPTPNTPPVRVLAANPVGRTRCSLAPSDGCHP
ncbi:polyprenyl synthetase family protein [Streptomyces sp. SCSIO 30461]|uniref:polyprenyl synthetase family protein n=1 Tax=Streptomyces sp. SCSIO 30461 TaxID=3118085 RepID=UPI0030D4A925